MFCPARYITTILSLWLAIKHILERRDVIGSANTGTGKTADIVCYDENPLENLSVLLTPKEIYKEGLKIV